MGKQLCGGWTMSMDRKINLFFRKIGLRLKYKPTNRVQLLNSKKWFSLWEIKMTIPFSRITGTETGKICWGMGNACKSWLIMEANLEHLGILITWNVQWHIYKRIKNHSRSYVINTGNILVYYSLIWKTDSNQCR